MEEVDLEVSDNIQETESTNKEQEGPIVEGEEELVCHCCGVKTEKARLHYGGITCYPCRSFFRRATVSKRKKKCKRNGRCEVKLEDRKSCKACRYQVCLQNGMRPHLVLSEGQIHDRFKNLATRRKKENILHLRKNTLTLDKQAIQPRGISSLKYGQAFSLDGCGALPQSCNENLEEFDYLRNTAGLVKTKFLIRDETNYLLALKGSEDEDSSLPCHRQAHIGQQRSVIMLASRKTNQEELQQPFDDVDEEYVENFEEEEEEQSRHIQMYIQHRDFVEFSMDSEMNVENEVDTMLLKTLNAIDIKEIENMYTTEEQCYIRFMGKKFCEKWCEVNIGPEVMSDYISWCKRERPLSPGMFQVVSRATSERFTRMVESTDEFKYLNIHDKFFLLKSNLKYADTVTMIRKLSFLNPKDNFFDLWGSEDRVLWEESGMSLHPESMSNILQEMPFDLRLKQQFIGLLSQCKLPILADQHVFSLLVAMVIFSSGEIQLIERDKIDDIRDGYMTMLRRYVRHQQEDVDDIINKVIMIISVIPKLSELFRKMNIIENI